MVARATGLGDERGCEVELTEVRTGGQDWWTLGFEATGPADLLRSELQASAAFVFAQALPSGVQPGPDESSSYAQWLSLRSPRPVPAPRGRPEATLPPPGHIEAVRPLPNRQGICRAARRPP